MRQLRHNVDSNVDNKKLNALTTLSLSLALLYCSACGFQLRGTDSEFASKARVFVDAAPDSTIKDELSKVLSDRSFAVVDNRDLANVLLRVADERQSRRIVSVEKTGRVSEYELSHSVNIQVTQSELSLQSDSVQSDAVQLGAVQSGAVQSDAVQQDSAQSESGRAESNQDKSSRAEFTSEEQEASAQAVDSEDQMTNRVEVIREYTYDERGVLGKEGEADILREEMRRELALQIVLRAVATMASTTASR